MDDAEANLATRLLAHPDFQFFLVSFNGFGLSEFLFLRPSIVPWILERRSSFIPEALLAPICTLSDSLSRDPHPAVLRAEQVIEWALILSCLAVSRLLLTGTCCSRLASAVLHHLQGEDATSALHTTYDTDSTEARLCRRAMAHPESGLDAELISQARVTPGLLPSLITEMLPLKPCFGLSNSLAVDSCNGRYSRGGVFLMFTANSQQLERGPGSNWDPRRPGAEKQHPSP